MLVKLALLFILMPIIEIAILIELGSRIGAFNTILIVIITGIIGAVLAKQQGMSIIHKIKEDIAFGNMPTESLFNGIFVLVGGILLITPGLITDFIGFTLLIPITRNVIKKIIRTWLEKKITKGTLNVHYMQNRW